MQRRLILGIALLFIASEQVPAYDLSQYQWHHRLLFLIAPRADDPDLAAQQRDLALRVDALLDRDIRLFRLLPDQGFLGKAALSSEAVRALRRQLDVTDADRLVILIGKDGGIKRRAELDTDLREILLQIDAMPMRRDEMRAKKEAGIPVTPPE